MGDSQLHALGAIDALRAFRAAELSPLELFDALTERIHRVDGADCADEVAGAINAVVQTLGRAREVAARAEQRYLAGVEEPLGTGSTALLGLPVATKEKHGIAGEPLSQGLSALRDDRADSDHPLIERIGAAGGVVHARTASPEYSCATVTHSPLWGVTRNPWNRRFSPGGSSGGAGAAPVIGSPAGSAGGRRTRRRRPG